MMRPLFNSWGRRLMPRIGCLDVILSVFLYERNLPGGDDWLSSDGTNECIVASVNLQMIMKLRTSTGSD